MAKTQKQIDEFFKSKKEQEQTLQPRSQMILNDEPLPSSIKKKDLLKKNYKFKTTHELWDTIIELENELKELKIKASSKSMAHICMQDDADRYYIELEEYRKLKSEVHKDIQRVWMYDADGNLDKDDILKRDYLIEKVFYTIANEWID